MAKTDALSIKVESGAAAKLIEKYGEMMEAIPAKLISEQLVNKNYSGDPMSGSVEITRLQSAVSQAQGTARTAMAGNNIKADPVTVNLNVHREIVEQWKKTEAERAGIENLVAKRKLSHQLSMVTELDTAFFTEAVSAGSEVVVTDKTTLVTKIEKLIQTVEAVTNDYIRKGVDRSLLRLSLTPEYFDLLEDYIVSLPNPDGTSTSYFKRVQTYVNLNQTEDAICMAVESIAQPVAIIPYAQEDLELSPNTAVSLFYDYGTKAIMPDLIMYADLGDVVSA